MTTHNTKPRPVHIAGDAALCETLLSPGGRRETFFCHSAITEISAPLANSAPFWLLSAVKRRYLAR